MADPTDAGTPPAADPTSAPGAADATGTLAGGAAPGAEPAGQTPPAAAPGTPPAADATPKTLAGGSASDTPTPAAATWPDNWREEMAKGDAKKLARLQRFNSPNDVFNSYTEIEGKVSAGKLKAVAEPLAADATPEQTAAWRKEQGLPDNADAFVAGLALPNGVTPGEADKPLLASFAEEATLAGWSQRQYNEAVGWYYKLQDSLLSDQQRGDEDFHIHSTQELQQEWGTEFRPNLTRITQFMDAHFPKEVQNIILSARANDGSIIGNHPAFNRVVLELAKFVNPVGAIMPNIPGANMTNVDDRIREIETKYLNAPRNSPEGQAYWVGGIADEYRNLLQVREDAKARQGAGR